MLFQHNFEMVGLLGGPNETVNGDGIRTEGMPENVIRPLYSQSLQPFNFKVEASIRHQRAFSFRKRAQYRGEVFRNLDQLPSAVFRLGVRKVDESSIEFDL